MSFKIKYLKAVKFCKQKLLDVTNIYFITVIITQKNRSKIALKTRYSHLMNVTENCHMMPKVKDIIPLMTA